MVELTYSDKGEIEDIVSTLLQANELIDIQIVEKVSEQLITATSSLNLHRSLARNALYLSCLLLLSGDKELKTRARGALLYLVEDNDLIYDSAGEEGYFDDHFVLNRATVEIGKLNSLFPSYHGPAFNDVQLSKIGQELESLRSFSGLDSLRDRVHAELEKLDSIFKSGFLVSFKRNAHHACALLQKADNSIKKDWIAAGLRYLFEDRGIFSQRVGLLWLIERDFALTMALERGSGVASLVPRLVNQTLREWPWLNSLLFRSDGKLNELTEFYIALAGFCRKMTEQKEHRNCLVVPIFGPLPQLLAFLCAVGVVYEANRDEGSESSVFKEGQKVLFDGNAVRIFVGYREKGGQKLFGLKEIRKRKGQKSESSTFLPATAENLARLTPADKKAKTRGRMRISSEQVTISPLDRMLHREMPARISGLKEKIILVSSVSFCRQFFSDIEVYGEALHRVVPVGSITKDNEFIPWRNRWNVESLLLLIAPDNTAALGALDRLEADCHVTLILAPEQKGTLESDTLNRISNHHRSLRVLSLVPQYQVEWIQEFAAAGYEITQWEKSDFQSISLSAIEREDLNLLATYERNFARRIGGKITLQEISSPEVDEAFQLFNSLQIEGREDEELNAVCACLGRAFSSLISWPLPLSDESVLLQVIEAELGTASKLFSRSRFSDEVARIFDGALVAIRFLLEHFKEQNPKWRALQSIYNEHDLAHVVMRSALLDAFRESAPAELAGKQTSAESSELRSGAFDGVSVVTGWFGKRRMAPLIFPPFSSDTRLLLYDCETEWCSQAYNHLKRVYQQVKVSTISGRMKAVLDVPDGVRESSSRAVSLDEMEENALKALKSRVLVSATGPSAEERVDCRFIAFHGGAYAFLTQHYSAVKVNALLQSNEEEGDPDEVDIALVNPDELQPDDLLLFVAGSARDVVKERADEFLLKEGFQPESTREAAAVWKVYLNKIRENRGLSITELAQMLEEHGLKRNYQTVRIWVNSDQIISPMDWRNEVPLIMTLGDAPASEVEIVKCVESISILRRTHLKASRAIARQLLESFKHDLSRGDSAILETEDVTILDDSLCIARVYSIDQEQSSVRRSICNQLLGEA